MSFTGEYSAKLNAKNQVTLPSALREAVFLLEEALPLVLFARDDEDFVEIYPQSEWRKVQQKTALLAREKRMPELNRLLNMRAYSFTLDSEGNGRILIPPPLMGTFKDSSDLVFIGNTNRIECWEAGKFRLRYGRDSVVDARFRAELSEILDF
ncbi:MAG: hypothetical protein HQL31_13880 [Planctomycetes bacterium]|nr:hypothetical protein [Planctomycetota bacterium]